MAQKPKRARRVQGARSSSAADPHDRAIDAFIKVGKKHFSSCLHYDRKLGIRVQVKNNSWPQNNNSFPIN